MVTLTERYSAEARKRSRVISMNLRRVFCRGHCNPKNVRVLVLKSVLLTVKNFLAYCWKIWELPSPPSLKTGQFFPQNIPFVFFVFILTTFRSGCLNVSPPVRFTTNTRLPAKLDGSRRGCTGFFSSFPENFCASAKRNCVHIRPSTRHVRRSIVVGSVAVSYARRAVRGAAKRRVKNEKRTRRREKQMRAFTRSIPLFLVLVTRAVCARIFFVNSRQ